MALSKRKLESYRRAELLARELRHQMCSVSYRDEQRLFKFLISWMRKTGKIKYDRPGSAPDV